MALVKVKWTSFAVIQLRTIYQYYKDSADTTVARRIKQHIISRANILKAHPQAGQIEETLAVLKQGHRYLVEGHVKLVYKKTGNTVYITDVFDTRQNPVKLKKRNK
jgi:toxin ParE1/3/4